MRFAYLAGLLAVVGCGYLNKPEPLIAGAVDMPAYPVYKQWFWQAQLCDRLTGDFNRIHFKYVPGKGWKFGDTPDGFVVIGYWDGPHPAGDTIYLAEAYVMDRKVVMHEMVHFLHGGGHPPVLFEASDSCPDVPGE